MTRNRMVKNVAANWVHLVYGMVWGIVLTPIFVKTLGKSDYGIWLLIHSMVGYYGLLDLGTRSAVIRFVSRGLARKDHQEVNEIVNTAIAIYSAIGAAALLLSVALGFLLPHFEKFAASEHPDVTLLVILIGANVAIALPGKMIEGVLSASERFDLSNGIAMAFAFVRNGIFIALLYSGGGLIELSWALFATTAVEQTTIAWTVRRQVPVLRYSFAFARRNRLRGIFNYGVHSFLGTAGDRLRLYSDALVIGSYLPSSAIAGFNIGQRPLVYINKMSLGISRVLTPAFSRTEASSSPAQLATMLIVGTRASTILTSLACVVLLLSGQDLLTLWVGDEFAESGAVLLALLPGYFLAAGAMPVNSILLGTSKHRVLSLVTIIEGIVNLGLSLWWVRTGGIVGVAWGTTVPMIAARFLLLPSYACRTIGLSFGRYLREALAPCLPGVVLGVAAGYGMKRVLPNVDLLSVIAVDLVVVVVYTGATLCVMLMTHDPIVPQFVRRRLSIKRRPSAPVDPAESELEEHSTSV